MSRVLEQKSWKQENVWQENMLKFWQKVHSLLSMEKVQAMKPSREKQRNLAIV